MTTDRQSAETALSRENWLLAIREETRQAVLEGDAQDCSSADCIADAVYEIVRVALAALTASTEHDHNIDTCADCRRLGG